MKYYQRELLLYRLITGKLKYPHGGLIIRSPTLSVLYEASEIYAQFYDSAVNAGIMTEQDSMNLLVSQGEWDQEKEKLLQEDLPKQIEHWKEEIYRAYYQSERKNTVRKYLEIAKIELNKLISIRHFYDHVSCSGVANYAKLQFIIEKCVYKGKKRYNWAEYSPYTLMSFQQENLIREEDIRELSHNHPWYIMWQAGKKVGNVFGKPSVKFDYDQQRLVMWSMLYDNINEGTEPPPQDIIDDDDALDGWMSIKRKEKGDNPVHLSSNEKINNAQEIYMPASTAEDAKKIDSLNSNYARAIKKQRFAAIKQKGEIREQDLPDIKQEVMMEYNRRFKGG
jgi:hypothetical protein